MVPGALSQQAFPAYGRVSVGARDRLTGFRYAKLRQQEAGAPGVGQAGGRRNLSLPLAIKPTPSAYRPKQRAWYREAEAARVAVWSSICASCPPPSRHITAHTPRPASVRHMQCE